MEIKTKFNIGDEVWFYSGHRAINGKVIGMKVETSMSRYGTDVYLDKEIITAEFHDKHGNRFGCKKNALWCYKTKEELIESLFS